MNGSLTRAVVATALITALGVSALSFFVGPRLMQAKSTSDGLQPALYNGQSQDIGSAQANSQYNDDSQPQLRRRPSAARTTSSRTYSSQTTYSEPVRHHH